MTAFFDLSGGGGDAANWFRDRIVFTPCLSVADAGQVACAELTSSAQLTRIGALEHRALVPLTYAIDNGAHVALPCEVYASSSSSAVWWCNDARRRVAFAARRDNSPPTSSTFSRRANHVHWFSHSVLIMARSTMRIVDRSSLPPMRRFEPSSRRLARCRSTTLLCSAPAQARSRGTRTLPLWRAVCRLSLSLCRSPKVRARPSRFVRSDRCWPICCNSSSFSRRFH
jgi:hypothetical protein